MATRTTATEVKQIIDTDLSDTIVDAYITAANAVVTEVLGSDTTITDTLKEEIERWYAAHLIAVSRERQLVKGEAGPASATYAGAFGAGLKGSTYGQQVEAMDSTGKMAALSRKSASFSAVTTKEISEWGSD